MTKKHKKTKENKKWVWGISAGTLVALLVVIGVLFLKNCHKENGEEPTESTGETTEQNLGNNVILLKAEGLSGAYPEDGSDTQQENVLVLTIKNNGDKLIQYTDIRINGIYSFKVTTLLPGDTMTVWEQNKSRCPENFSVESAELENFAEFIEAPSLQEGLLRINGLEGIVTVENITTDTMIPPVTVYYKKVKNGILQGGITYRVTTGTLKPGASESVSSRHFDPVDSVVLFATYGN